LGACVPFTHVLLVGAAVVLCSPTTRIKAISTPDRIATTTIKNVLLNRAPWRKRAMSPSTRWMRVRTDFEPVDAALCSLFISERRRNAL
jgi:hypothetical protein